MVAISV